MQLVLHGGFGEKGRTALGIETDSYRLLLDAGIKTSARGDDYYPAIDADTLRATDAIVLTHAHEDHIAAIGWCIARGFQGRILATRESEREILPCVAAYGEAGHFELVRAARFETLPIGNGALRLGPLRLTTGRSGHTVGGVWCLIDDGALQFCYCGDVVPASPVLVMDPLPKCDVIAIDASYGDDTVAAAERVKEIADWMAAHPKGAVLPTPRLGRSIELLAILPGPVALAPGMRDAVAAQIAHKYWLNERAGAALAARLDAAADWREGDPLPCAALLCDDGMGLSGPTRGVLQVARATRQPTLFTGHLPDGSPGARMLADGAADWIRLPTHPTLTENIAMVMETQARVVLGHSCEHAALARLARYLPSLRADAATGDRLEL